MGKRVEWIDRMKGILILLVVLGHVVGSAANVSSGTRESVLRGCFKFIYLFHMPAFFVLAGITLKAFDFRKKFRRLLVPYFVFGALSAFVYLVLVPEARTTWWHPWASLAYGAAFPGTDGFRCNSVLWFLPCLFMTTWACSFLIRLVDRAKRPVIVGCCVSILSVLAYVFLNRCGLPSLPYGGSLILKYLPFVVFGHLMGTERFTKKFCLVALILYGLFDFWAPFDWGMYFTYWKWGVAVLLGVLGTCGCCYLAGICPWRGLSWIGGMSIGIMLSHKWAILGCNRLMGCYNVGVVFMGSILCSIILVWVTRRMCPSALGEARLS